MKAWVKDRASGELVCRKCRKPRVKRDDGYLGQDPCIADLPGVTAACCGHGVHAGYVAFEDGRVIRGLFDHHIKGSVITHPVMAFIDFWLRELAKYQ